MDKDLETTLDGVDWHNEVFIRLRNARKEIQFYRNSTDDDCKLKLFEAQTKSRLYTILLDNAEEDSQRYNLQFFRNGEAFYYNIFEKEEGDDYFERFIKEE